MDGNFNFNRKLLNSPLWLSEKFTKGQAWIDLIGLANYKPSHFFVRGNRVEVARGQVAWSEISLAERWKWSRGKVRRFLTKIGTESDSKGESKIVQQKSNVTTLITIVNYDRYQYGGTADSTTDGTTDGTHPKKEKKEKNTPYREIVDLYHEILPELSGVIKITDTRKKRIKARWNESEKTCYIEWWRKYFEKVKGIKFLMGNNRDWRADFDFLTTQSKFIKILEDKYN